MREAGLCNIYLVAPTTPEDRIELIVKRATGFIYYVSREGVTGMQAKVSDTIGDMTRKMSHIRNDRSLYYVQQSLGKKSLCVDLRDPRGMALITALVPKVDVVVENFKPGTLAQMGLGYERLCELREDVILCSISALGQSGPLAELPGYDLRAYPVVALGMKDMGWWKSAHAVRVLGTEYLKYLIARARLNAFGAFA
jgi:hypothetical protein